MTPSKCNAGEIERLQQIVILKPQNYIQHLNLEQFFGLQDLFIGRTRFLRLDHKLFIKQNDI